MMKTLNYERPNVLLITLDSCRWDSYVGASMPFLNAHCAGRKAYSQATFTYASHLAMLQGILPGTIELRPYYNRYSKQLIRIANRRTGPTSLITFPMGTENIVTGFGNDGYRTIGLGAMEWFKHPHLSRGFDYFEYTGIHAEKQVDLFLKNIKYNTPIFGLINFGETHDPYEFKIDSRVPDAVESRARRRSALRFGAMDHIAWQRQSQCCDYIDKRIETLFHEIRNFGRNTIFIVCGDHGECFGEDGNFGHGFYHPKVMEVPLAIFDFDGELTL